MQSIEREMEVKLFVRTLLEERMLKFFGSSWKEILESSDVTSSEYWHRQGIHREKHPTKQDIDEFRKTYQKLLKMIAVPIEATVPPS
jgi:hypothetical protein